MTDWKGRITTGLIAVPIIFLVMNIPILAILTFNIVMYLTNKEYQNMVMQILKMHSGESEHSYLDQMNRSTLAVLPTHFFALVAAITVSEDYTHIAFLMAVMMQFMIRIKGFISYYNVLTQSKEFLSKDPALDRKIILLTFLQTAGDLLGMVFLHLPFTYGALMFLQKDGLKYTFFWILCTFQADNGALWVGSLIGHTPFVYSISPKKTWEGVCGAIFVCVVTALIFSKFTWVYFVPDFATKHFLILSFLSSIVCIIGDLLESFIKRAANMKDSGNMLPGHGGLLDRMDSIVCSAPVFYFYIKVVIGF